MTGTHGPHLRRRNGIFHFRMKVPDALQLRVGTVEIWRSFKTYSPTKARHLAAKYSVRLTEVFEVMKQESLTKLQCRALASTVLRDLSAEVEASIQLEWPETPFAKIEQHCLSQERVTHLTGKVGLQDPALVFHSFRHGMEDALRNARQPQYVIDRIIGHSDRSVSAGYGEGVNLEVAQEAIQDAVLPVNIVELLGRQPCS